MQNVAMRERMFTMRLSEEESTRLDRVAAHYGLNAAGLLRMLLKREGDALGSMAERHARLFFTTDRDRVIQAGMLSGVLDAIPDDATMMFDVLKAHTAHKIGTFTAQAAIDFIATYPGSLFGGFGEDGKPIRKVVKKAGK